MMGWQNGLVTALEGAIMEPMKLVELLKGNVVYIQTHNFPDPDAIASAFGLQYFLKQHGKKNV